MTSFKVLIVDDNKLLCWGMGRMLKKRNIAHQVAEDGKNALSKLCETFYDLVFLDIHLPDANGLDLMQDIRRISPGTKVVIISSDGSEDNARRALAAGALMFIEKPFDDAELMTALAALQLGQPPSSSSPRREGKLTSGRTSGSDSAGTDT